jgi:hypothetical protein
VARRPRRRRPTPTQAGRTNAAFVNPFQGLQIDARGSGSYFVTSRDDAAGFRRVLLNAGAEGRATSFSFPYDAFEYAVLSRLEEIDPREILGDDKPDESAALASELAGVEAELAKAESYMDRHGFSATIGKRVTALETRQYDLNQRLAEA